MVDRVIVYDGAIPQTTDVLETNKFGMLGLAFASRAILGSNTEVHGLAIAPTSPASMNVTISPGSIYQLDETDATAYGDLGVDASTIYKQGINYNTVTLTATAPTTAGFSQNYLVQIALDDIDAGTETLSYFNATNPAEPWSGPFNSGQSQFTQRTCQCVVALKAGVAATTGTQTTPSADAGFTGLYSITVANGATQITSGNISTLTTAPFFPTLPAVPSDVQTNAWTYAVDTSSGGAPFATNATTTTASAVLHFASVPAWVVSGMGVFDLTATTAITGGQTVLGTTATTVTLSATVNATVSPADVIAFSFNTITASISPVPAALVPGLSARVKLSSTNTGAATLNLNGLGATSVKRAQGTNLAGGDLNANMIADLCYDGTNFQIVNYEGTTASTANTTTTISIPYTTDTSSTVNLITANFTPSIGSLSAGLTIEVKIANTTSGATNINVNGLGNTAVKDRFLNAITQGSLVAGEVALMIYDGTQFQVVNNVTPSINGATTFYVNNSTGNDSNNGLTTGTAWATISHAISALTNYNLNGNQVTVQLATTGISYAMPTSFVAPSYGTLVLQGDTSNQANVTIFPANGSVGVATIGSGNISIQYLTLFNSSLGANCYHIFVESTATVNVTSCTFTASGTMVEPNIFGGPGVLIQLNAGNIYGAAAAGMWWASAGCTIAMNGNAANQTGPTWSVAGVVAQFGGLIELVNGHWTWSGSGAVGPKYNAAYGGVINTGGRSANFFPGNSPGTTQFGFYL